VSQRQYMIFVANSKLPNIGSFPCLNLSHAGSELQTAMPVHTLGYMRHRIGCTCWHQFSTLFVGHPANTGTSACKQTRSLSLGQQVCRILQGACRNVKTEPSPTLRKRLGQLHIFRAQCQSYFSAAIVQCKLSLSWSYLELPSKTANKVVAKTPSL